MVVVRRGTVLYCTVPTVIRSMDGNEQTNERPTMEEPIANDID